MADKDTKLKLFLKAIEDTDSDKVLIKAAESQYSSEIETVKTKAEDLVETAGNKLRGSKGFNEKKLNPTGTAPTLVTEQIESNIKDRTPNAENTVMRPNLPGVSKNSTFFKGMSYDVSLDEIEATKKLGNGLNVGANIDVFDKSIGAGIEKNYNNGKVQLKGGVEYQPLDKAGKLKMDYTTSQSAISGTVYLNKENSGINANYFNKLSKTSEVGASVSVFQHDTAFRADYKKTFKDKSTLTMGLYGTTKSREIGVSARIGF